MAKRATTAHIAGIELDRNADTPLHEQIDRAFRRAILEGRLAGGSRIPSSRALAEQLGVSRLTVVSAFEQLAAEGYLESRVGSGTRVTRALPADHFKDQRPGGRNPAVEGQLRPVRLSRRGAAITAFTPRREAQQGVPRPFRLGAPALDAFPYVEWIRISTACRRRIGREALGYGEPAGYRPLREAIAGYLGPARGVRCTAENVVILSGAQQGFGVALRLLADPGDSVWVEDPGYAGARGAAVAAGVRPTPVPVDEEGLTLNWKTKSPAPRLAFVTPSHQFPLGVTMSLTRRLALLDWAGQSGVMIVEDDYGSEYRYTGRPLAALQGLDTQDRVIYVGTFSKVLFPALRLAYAVLPARLVEAFAAVKGMLDGHATLLEQATVAEFLAAGSFTRHIARMRAVYRERQDALLEAAGRRLKGLLEVQPTATGMHLVAWLPPNRDDRAVARAAARAGIEVAPLSSFRVQASGPPGLILGFAASSPSAIDTATAALVTVLNENGNHRRGHPSRESQRAAGPRARGRPSGHFARRLD